MPEIGEVLMGLFEDGPEQVLYFHLPDDDEPSCVLVTAERWLEIGSLIEDLGHRDLLLGPRVHGAVDGRRSPRRA